MCLTSWTMVSSRRDVAVAQYSLSLQAVSLSFTNLVKQHLSLMLFHKSHR